LPIPRDRDIKPPKKMAVLFGRQRCPTFREPVVAVVSSRS
jgi:hypothetical protein